MQQSKFGLPVTATGSTRILNEWKLHLPFFFSFLIRYIMLYIVLDYLMLHIVLACLMLFAALSNAVCLYNASYLPMISAIAFYFCVLSWFFDTVCLFHVLTCIMRSAFNLLFFPNSMFTLLLLLCFFIERAMCSPEK